MKEDENNIEKRNYLIPIIARYRIFLMKWLDVDKTHFKQILSRRMGIGIEECSLKNLNTDKAIVMIKELKNFKYELTGSKRLPEKVNPRAYAIKIKYN